MRAFDTLFETRVVSYSTRGERKQSERYDGGRCDDGGRQEHAICAGGCKIGDAHFDLGWNDCLDHGKMEGFNLKVKYIKYFPCTSTLGLGVGGTPS